MIEELTKKAISFYPCIGRTKYNVYTSLSDEERGRKENRPRFSKLSVNTLSLSDIADYISSPLTKTGYGTGMEKALPALTEEVRNSEDYKTKKTFLFDNVVFAGVPEYKEEERTDKTTGKTYIHKTQRRKANFTDKAIYSGYVVIDLDHLREQGISLNELRDRVSKDTEIGLKLLFISPSGDGLKLVCKSKKGYRTPEEYEREYYSLVLCLSRKLKEVYPSFVVDTSGKDISRTCFLCHDPEVQLFENDLEFDSTNYPVPEKERPVRRTYANYDTGDDGIEEIVRRVEERGTDIAPTYKEYFPLVCSFSALGERGRDYLHRVCSLSTKYNPEDTDIDFDTIKGTPQSIGYFINLCRSNGIDVTLKDYFKSKQIDQNNNDLRPTDTQDNKTPYQTTNTAQNGGNEPEKNNMERYLTPLSLKILKELAEEKKEGIKTPYIFTKSDGKKEGFFLRPGAITMICGKTSQGKSKLLQNLALQVSETCTDGESVLYFTLEEELVDILLQFANIEIDKTLSKFETSNIDQLRRYYQTGETHQIPTDTMGDFTKGINCFESLVFGGKLRVYYPETNQVENLIEIIDFLFSKMKVKAVFVDYIQLLYKNGKRNERREEIKDICEALQRLAISEGVPFVVAAQLNRETKNPEQMSEDNIADSADLSRYANTILNLWNSRFKNVREYEDNNDHRRGLEGRGFKLGEPGKLYFRLDKNRGGSAKIDGVFTFNEESGKIYGNDGETATEQKRPLFPDDNDQDNSLHF